MKEVKSVPSLRFPEFEEEWNLMNLGKEGYFKNGINKDKSDFGHGVPFINLMDVFGKDTVLSDNLSLVNATKSEIKTYDLRKGDILFIRSSVKRSGVGETALVLEDLSNTVYSGFLIRYRFNKEALDDLFKKYCFWTSSFRQLVISYSTTSANTNINQESLNLLTLKIPTLPEQQKIASFLTAVDTKIEQLTKKKNLLEQYKKGVMRKIFSQEIRFKPTPNDSAYPAGKYPDWEEKKLGKLSELITKGTTPTSMGFSFQTEGVNFIKAENISGSYFIDIDSTPKISDECNTALKRSKLETNDVLFSIAGTLGRTAIVTEKDLPANTNQALAIIRLKQDVNVLYMNFALNSSNIKKRISQLLSVGAQPNLSLEQIGNFLIPFPCLEEQTQIAHFLSAIDDKIKLVSTQLEKTKVFKKGLLQQMFV